MKLSRKQKLEANIRFANNTPGLKADISEYKEPDRDKEIKEARELWLKQRKELNK